MAAIVSAEFQERDRIIFRARGRSSVNVRRMLDDGPIGYTSTELLLVAVGNCSLGWLSNHPLLVDEPLRLVTARFEAEMAVDPPRVAKIVATLNFEVTNPGLLAAVTELEAIACTCPMCNSLTSEREIHIEISMVGAGAAAGK